MIQAHFLEKVMFKHRTLPLSANPAACWAEVLTLATQFGSLSPAQSSAMRTSLSLPIQRNAAQVKN